MNKKNKTKISNERKNNYHRSGRWINEPKPEHKIVLNALEIANNAYMRVVTVSEIIPALSSKEKSSLNEKYKSSLNQTVCKILGLLCKREKVFVGGKSGNSRYYGLVGLLNPEQTNLNNFQSRRQKILKLIQIAVIENKRALQMGEIIEFVQRTKDFSSFNVKLISQSILSLKETGELIKFPMRGDEKGFGIYLPKEFNPEEFLPKQPLTWLEFVLHTCNEIWDKHKIWATSESTIPLPITTSEVRATLVKSDRYAEKLINPALLTNALKQLAGTENPSLRSVSREGQKTRFWLPLDVKCIFRTKVNGGIREIV